MKAALAARLIIVVAAALVGILGSRSLPLDEHEVFVARTAEEMLQRGSVIVPYFEGQPRLTKPPLAYWLTMLVDEAGDRDHIISEWEARVPPILGGVLLALATFSLTATLFDSMVALVAALMLVCSAGFIAYTHSARPEMLYAMFCTAGLACFAKAWVRTAAPQADAGSPAPSALWPWLGWLMMGLAILTKGPQLPLILVGAWAAAMWFGGQRGLILRTIRPFSGLLIAAAVCLWWFIMIWTSVSRGGSTMEHETIGRIFDFEGEPLTRYLDPYYVYRTGGLLLPWGLPYAIALLGPWLREIRLERGAKVLWWISVLTIAVMHLTLNRRWYYLLPLTGVVSGLMAWTSLALGRALTAAGRARTWRVLTGLHVLAAGAVIVVLAFKREALWSHERFVQRDVAREVGRLIPADQTVIGWRTDWQIEQYYLHRVIPSFNEPAQLRDALHHAGEAWLLMNSRKPCDLPANLHGEIVHRFALEDGEVQAWRVSGRPTSRTTSPAQ